MHFVELFKIQIWSGLANPLSLILSVQLPFYCLMGNIESVALSLIKSFYNSCNMVNLQLLKFTGQYLQNLWNHQMIKFHIVSQEEE